MSSTLTLPRTEPAYIADELTMLRSFLDHLRATLLKQAEGLTADQLNQRLEPSTLTLGGLLKHLAWVEDWWFVVSLGGDQPSPPWDEADWDADDDWEINTASQDHPDQIRGLFVEAVRRSNQILDKARSVEDVAARKLRSGGQISLRRILLQMVQEYSRHAGHADLIRESIDGATDV